MITQQPAADSLGWIVMDCGMLEPIWSRVPAGMSPVVDTAAGLTAISEVAAGGRAPDLPVHPERQLPAGQLLRPSAGIRSPGSWWGRG